MKVNVEEHAINWRWKKLNEVPTNPVEPKGICGAIDFAVWGGLSWEQKSLISPSPEEIIKMAMVVEDDPEL